MKKSIIVFIFLISNLTIYSQIKVRPGARLGLNSSNISNLENSSRKTGINAAAFINIKFADFYQLQPEFTFSQQGASYGVTYSQFYDPYDPIIQTYTQDVDLNISYVGVSIANKFFIIPNLGLHFIVGPSIEVNVNDDGADITPVDFALFGGIGYEFPFGLGIEARYKQGFIDIRDGYDGSYYSGNYYYDYGNDHYYDGNNLLNGVIQASVYYKFDF